MQNDLLWVNSFPWRAQSGQSAPKKAVDSVLSQGERVNCKVNDTYTCVNINVLTGFKSRKNVEPFPSEFQYTFRMNINVVPKTKWQDWCFITFLVNPFEIYKSYI